MCHLGTFLFSLHPLLVGNAMECAISVRWWWSASLCCACSQLPASSFLELIWISYHSWSVEVKTTSSSLRGHIGPLNHVDYWFEDGFAYFEHVVQSQIFGGHGVFLVSDLRFAPNKVPLKLRCPYSSYVGIRYTSTLPHVSLQFKPWRSQSSQAFHALIVAHKDDDMLSSWYG